MVGDAIRSLKLAVVRGAKQRPFWLTRYYDFNVHTEAKRVEKLNYMHWNPMKRGLVMRPEDWAWSSCRFYQTGVQGRVKVECWWAAP